MRSEYDFSNGIKNPYVKPAKTAITIRLDKSAVEYFKSLAEQVNMPYQTLINSYLAECAAKKKKPKLVWNG
jgi:predicted DNA binding CopG/RHH family protein